MVLDGLGLVQDAGVEFLVLIQGLVTAEQVVAGHHHVGPVPLLGQLGPVQGQPGVGLAQLGPGKLQCLVQLVQHLHGIVQPEQTAIAQAVVALFLVERSQQGFQLSHRELPRVHLKVEHAAVHRHPHRNLRRCGLHTAEGIGQVDLASASRAGMPSSRKR